MVLVEGIQTEQITASLGGGQAHRTEPGALVDHSGNDLPEGKFSLSVVTESVGNAKLLGQSVEETITRHDRPVVVVLSAEGYSQLLPQRKIVDVLCECPEPGLSVERRRDTPRGLEL